MLTVGFKSVTVQQKPCLDFPNFVKVHDYFYALA